MKDYRKTLLLAILVLLGPLSLSAQEYFGQNRVRYRTFDFKVLKTQVSASHRKRLTACGSLATSSDKNLRATRRWSRISSAL